jgi:SsrA-binding protein
MIGSVEQKGLTLVPLDIHVVRGRAKLTLALGRGKKLHDRRDELRRKAAERELARALSRRQ